MNNDKKLWSIRQASKEIGVPSWELRKYCNAGLITGIKRTRNGYRMLNAEQLEHLKMLVLYFNCGFTLPEMKRLKTSNPEQQKALLETKRRQMWQKISELQEGIGHIERRIEILDRENPKL